MNVVAAGLGLRGDHAGHGLTELGVVVLQRYFCFSDRIEVRIHHDDAQNRILIVGSVKLEPGAAEVLALGEDLLAALRILRGSVAPADDLL